MEEISLFKLFERKPKTTMDVMNAELKRLHKALKSTSIQNNAIQLWKQIVTLNATLCDCSRKHTEDNKILEKKIDKLEKLLKDAMSLEG